MLAWLCAEDLCVACGKGHKSNTIIECERCLGGFHMGCLHPPLKAVPKVRYQAPGFFLGPLSPTASMQPGAQRTGHLSACRSVSSWLMRFELKYQSAMAVQGDPASVTQLGGSASVLEAGQGQGVQSFFLLSSVTE